jgi:hypothetical protein
VGSNAATDFYGSLICDSISNVGGWTFHYDTRLGTIGDGKWILKHYWSRDRAYRQQRARALGSASWTPS